MGGNRAGGSETGRAHAGRSTHGDESRALNEGAPLAAPQLPWHAARSAGKGIWFEVSRDPRVKEPKFQEKT
jgi:hypothetical protein